MAHSIDSETIDAIVLDVGRVLVDYDYGRFFAPLTGKFGLQIEDPEQFLCAHGLLDHEHGTLSGSAFLEGLRSAVSSAAKNDSGSSQAADIDELHRFWTAIFEPIAGMDRFLEELVRHHRVYLLSNTGELHWKHVRSRYSFLDAAHGAVASFEAGVMKPAPAIYQLVEERFDLLPERMVFVDDRRENVEAALGRGWHGIVHVSPAMTRSALIRLGVRGL